LELKALWLAIFLPVFALLATGCGGIQASQGVSPASFFLPGLLKNQTDDTTIPSLAQTQSPSTSIDSELAKNSTQSN
jgi:hypothetical protein